MNPISTLVISPASTNSPNFATPEVVDTVQPDIQRTALATRTEIAGIPPLADSNSATSTTDALLLNTQPPATATITPDTVVVVSSLNLREGPDTVFPILRSFSEGTFLSIIGRNSNSTWVKVQTLDKSEGWMFVENLGINITLSPYAAKRGMMG